MPKERLHMLLAQESLRVLSSYHGVPSFNERSQFSYLLGSIFPDMLFYDLPYFALSPLGQDLHRLEGETILTFSSVWLEEAGASPDPDFVAWLLGLTSHFLADGLYHPVIDKLSSRSCKPCRDLALSKRNCHHWLESEMEGYWIALIGPPDGYFSLLDRFRREAHGGGKYFQYFRELLVRAGVGGAPDGKKIARCLLWQTLLLREFAKRRWAHWKPHLLKTPWFRFLGTLIIPRRGGLFLEPPAHSASGFSPTNSLLQDEGEMAQEGHFDSRSSRTMEKEVRLAHPSPRSPHTREFEGIWALFGHPSMARAVTYLASRLRSLPVWPL